MQSGQGLPVPGIPAYVLHICTTLHEAGHAAYVVGGGVRDALLGRRPKDWDVATDAAPEQVQQLFPRTVPTGLRFGTVTVLEEEGARKQTEPNIPGPRDLGGAMGRPRQQSWTVEVTTFRGESGYADGRRPDEVQFIGSIEDDLVRRDFTVNAIAFDPASSTIVDPHGGQDDLRRRVLRAVGDADTRFEEDALRVLRAVRLATELDFTIEAITDEALRRKGPGLERISRERIGGEWRRMLLSADPGRGLHLLHEYALLPYMLIDSPEHPHKTMATAATMDETNRFETKTAERVAKAAVAVGRVGKPDIVVRTAVALHGLGPPNNHRRWLNGLVYPKRIIRDVVAITVPMATFKPSSYIDDVALRRFLSEIGRARVEAFFVAAAAVHPGAELEAIHARAERIVRSKAALQPGELALDGGDIQTLLGVTPGPRIGELLHRLFQHVLRHPEDNTRSRLSQLLTAWNEASRS